MATLFRLPRAHAIDGSGSPYAGARAYFFATGTSTPQDTYQDSALTTPHAHPVVADVNGQFDPIYLDPGLDYKLTLNDSSDTLIYTEDPVNDLPEVIYRRTDAEISAGVTPVSYQYPFGHVLRYGAVGDGVTDDTTAIQNAATAAGTGGEVFFPAGYDFVTTSTVTIPDFQTWRGDYLELGAGPSNAKILSTQTSGTCFSVGEACNFYNIRFKGVMSYTDATGAVSGSTAVCMVLDGGIVTNDVVWQTHYHCIETHSTFYMTLTRGEANRCSVLISMRDADVFNLTLNGFKSSYCNTIIYSNDSPVRYVHNLKVFGGSFELWAAGGLFGEIASASFFGSYFETSIDGGFGFNSTGNFTDVVSLSFFGCLIFLNSMNRFVNYSGLTGGTFVSIGNVVAGSANTGQNQFYFVPMDAGTGRVIMLGDYLDDRGTGTFQGTYVSDTAKVRNQLIIWPRSNTTDHANVGQTWIDGGIVSKPVTLADDATPSVAGGSIFLTGGTTTITDFDDGVEGQIIRIISEHAITITDGTNIFLSGSANFVMAATDTLTLICKADGLWYELSRSDNT